MVKNKNTISIFNRGIKEFIENNKDDIYKCSLFIKYISVSFPHYKNKSLEIPLIINIIEAVLYDYFVCENSNNALFGLSLLPLLQLKHINVIGCEGIKIWIILYFLWNMNMGDKTYDIKRKFSHNFPPLYTSLLSFGFTPDEILTNFCLMRASSIRTSIMLIS
jgi:hypothetical protein